MQREADRINKSTAVGLQLRTCHAIPTTNRSLLSFDKFHTIANDLAARNEKLDRRKRRRLARGVLVNRSFRPPRSFNIFFFQDLAGTAKLNAHVLTERLPVRSLLPNKLRCSRTKSELTGVSLASHAARVASFVHCRTRGCEAIFYPLLFSPSSSRSFFLSSFYYFFPQFVIARPCRQRLLRRR